MTGKTLNMDTAVAADAERATEMTEPKITREFIERIQSRKEPISFAAMEALCTLALQAEALEQQLSTAREALKKARYTLIDAGCGEDADFILYAIRSLGEKE